MTVRAEPSPRLIQELVTDAEGAAADELSPRDNQTVNAERARAAQSFRTVISEIRTVVVVWLPWCVEMRLKIRCNECNALIRTVPTTDLQRTLTEMELRGDVASAICPHCGRCQSCAGILATDRVCVRRLREGCERPRISLKLPVSRLHEQTS